MARKSILAACAFSLIFGGLGTANAAIMSVTGIGDFLDPAAGTIADDDNLDNGDRQGGFDELQGFSLLGDLDVDGPTDIAAGTRISSHMIFLNRTDNGNGSRPITQAIATWTFDGDILGVMSDSGGNLEAASNFLGDTNVTYPGAFAARGFEGGDNYSDITTAPLNTFTVDMRVTQPGDWIRVITASAVPVPSAMLLFGTGLIGLIAFRGLKKK